MSAFETPCHTTELYRTTCVAKIHFAGRETLLGSFGGMFKLVAGGINNKVRI